MGSYNKNRRQSKSNKISGFSIEDTAIWKNQLKNLMLRGFTKEEALLILRMDMCYSGYSDSSHRMNMRALSLNDNMLDKGQFR